ncbi:MAG: tetratricopeptide repeat protein [Prochloraceae cyanobacterium]|nr:tetratricopeptide repeat protein [Prochloraceae cyanobacterium]
MTFSVAPAGQDLKIYPTNGWSLYGLAQSLQKQGKLEEAKALQTQFKEAWKYADVTKDVFSF